MSAFAPLIFVFICDLYIDNYKYGKTLNELRAQITRLENRIKQN